MVVKIPKTLAELNEPNTEEQKLLSDILDAHEKVQACDKALKAAKAKKDEVVDRYLALAPSREEMSCLTMACAGHVIVPSRGDRKVEKGEFERSELLVKTVTAIVIEELANDPAKFANVGRVEEALKRLAAQGISAEKLEKLTKMVFIPGQWDGVSIYTEASYERRRMALEKEAAKEAAAMAVPAGEGQ